MIRGIRPPARTSSKITFVLRENSARTSPFSAFTTPLCGKISMMSPIFNFDTSISIGRAPESSMVLKNIGAIFPPIQTPPARLLGTFGISFPISQSTELVALLRDDPVPTTSPTYARGWPFCFSCSICSIGPISPSLSGLIPSRAFFSIARACFGMSGRDHASGAGDRSSVFVSPVTLNTVTVIFSGTSGLDKYHSASAQLWITFLAASFPPFASSSTSWNASNTRIVWERHFTATGAISSSLRSSIRVAML
mmetsp:Transcript_5441/g.9107  ORF Transcript_5441/g.9107 Transcript_5441/m.9107 type:complete len:252 (-) Transcript_5441:364-1119(-)